MSIHPIRTLPDGTRVYSQGQKYKPKPQAERKYKVRKPDDPRAVRWCGTWLLPIDVLNDEQRSMPETREDRETYEHMSRSVLCDCDVCRRPTADRWRRKWRKDNGLRP